MSRYPLVRLLSIFGCLVFFECTVIAQDAAIPLGNVVLEDDDSRVTDATESASPTLNVRRRESFIGRMLRSIGLIGMLIPIAGLVCFVLTLIVVIRGNGPFAAVAIVFLVPIPVLLGLFDFVRGLISSLSVISLTSTSLKPSEICGGVAEALFNPMLGLVAMIPSYFVVAIGAFVRSFEKPTIKS